MSKSRGVREPERIKEEKARARVSSVLSVSKQVTEQAEKQLLKYDLVWSTSDLSDLRRRSVFERQSVSREKNCAARRVRKRTTSNRKRHQAKRESRNPVAWSDAPESEGRRQNFKERSSMHW